MKRYLFNVQTTYAVMAESQEQAQEMLDNGQGELRDRDTLLVEVTATCKACDEEIDPTDCDYCDSCCDNLQMNWPVEK